MLLFPQLQSGALVQYPLVKTYTVSNVTNLQEDGTRYRSGAINPVEVSWTLAFARLTQTEADALRLFFETAVGQLLPFTFLDPLINLLSWSQDFTQPIWTKSPAISITTTQSDSFTTALINNSGSATAQIAQSLQCPAIALLCFSVYARADKQMSLVLSIDEAEQTFIVGSTWKQFYLTQSGTGNSETKTVGLTLETGQAQISRVTVCAQPAPTFYTSTQETSGVMMRARFDQDSLSFTATDSGEFSCEVRLTSRLT